MRHDVLLLSDSLVTSTAAEVSAAEAELGVPFPPGYREYVTELGRGEYEGFLYVWPPDEIVRDRTGLQRDWREYAYFWEKEPPLTPEEMGRLIPLATTMDGDYLGALPSAPPVLYVLPRHQDRIHVVGQDLEDALAWFRHSGLVWVRQPKRILEGGVLVERDLAIFDPGTRIPGAEFLLGDGYEESQRRLLEFATDHHPDALFLERRSSETQIDCVVFLRASGGSAVCEDSEEEVPRVRVVCDPTRPTRTLRALLDLCHGLAENAYELRGREIALPGGVTRAFAYPLSEALLFDESLAVLRVEVPARDRSASWLLGIEPDGRIRWEVKRGDADDRDWTRARMDRAGRYVQLGDGSGPRGTTLTIDAESGEVRR